MIDSLEASRRLWTQSDILDRFLMQKGQYGVVTLHRPSNVDNLSILKGLIGALAEVSRHCPIIFPIHPRTRKALETAGQFEEELYFGDPPFPSERVCCVEPVGYLDFMCLVANARLVLTDSGGIQEETTVLGIPCLTLRENTERPITVTHGTNQVIGSSPKRVLTEAMKVLEAPRSTLASPPLWDGHASERTISILKKQFLSRSAA